MNFSGLSKTQVDWICAFGGASRTIPDDAAMAAAQEVVDEALGLLSPDGGRCLTWPETGCINRIHEGLMFLAWNGVTCFPCAHHLRLVDRDHRLTDRGQKMPPAVRPYAILFAGRFSPLP